MDPPLPFCHHRTLWFRNNIQEARSQINTYGKHLKAHVMMKKGIEAETILRKRVHGKVADNKTEGSNLIV